MKIPLSAVVAFIMRERTPRAELKPSLSPYLLTRAQIEARLISESMNKGRSSVVHTHYKAT